VTKRKAKELGTRLHEEMRGFLRSREDVSPTVTKAVAQVGPLFAMIAALKAFEAVLDCVVRAAAELSGNKRPLVSV
jgi:hypothetical protein